MIRLDVDDGYFIVLENIKDCMFFIVKIIILYFLVVMFLGVFLDDLEIYYFIIIRMNVWNSFIMNW